MFQRADNIENGWRAVQPFLDAWARTIRCRATRPGKMARAGDNCWP
ncbi:hypothetical protein QNM99_20360 [Pseudomonas sp. PCH446]